MRLNPSNVLHPKEPNQTTISRPRTLLAGTGEARPGAEAGGPGIERAYHPNLGALGGAGDGGPRVQRANSLAQLERRELVRSHTLLG